MNECLRAAFRALRLAKNAFYNPDTNHKFARMTVSIYSNDTSMQGYGDIVFVESLART